MVDVADYSFATELFFEELLRISSGFIWKDPYESQINESPEFIVEVEQYILSRQGRLSFPIVEQFADEVLQSLGFDAIQTGQMMDDRENIPEAFRDIAVKRQMEYTISHYVERNNYYRRLNGQPDYEDKPEDFFYNTEYPEISDSETPIHLLDTTQLYALETHGFLQKLIDANPNKKYLKHLTDKKIDIYVARSSEIFSILWIRNTNYTKLLEDFLETYNECRTMIVKVFYQKIMINANSQYINFLGLMINFQTILQMHRKFLDTDITRDFYDEDSLRLVYDSYDVPFYSAIPLEYHRKIVKNMNILLSHKGSTRVFYDLFDIFNFDKMAVFEFYLMKVHKFVDGKPAFYKNEDGTTDKSQMYDILFGKVKLYNDPTTEMQEPRNQERYEDVIRDDPYWINDKDLLDKLYEEEFNYMETKYLGIQTTFNLMKIIYETCYYLKMILDNRKLLSATSVYNNATHSNVNLFDLVVYLSALIIRKYGYESTILTDLHEVGKVMGFNFIDDLKTIKENISKNDYLKNDTTLLKLLETMTVNSLESIRKVYKNLSALRGYLTSKMAETDNVQVYWAYYELYQTMMYSEYAQETFEKSNGETAESFADMLQDCNPELYERYKNPLVYDPNQEISDALYLLKNSCDALSHIQYADSINIDMIIEYLFKLLKFFKSAKAELTGYEIVYSLISNYENIMKFMDLIVRIYDDHTSDPLESILILQDMIALIRKWMHVIGGQFELTDEIVLEMHKMAIQDILDFTEDFLNHIVDELYGLMSVFSFIDDIHVKECFLPQGDPLTLEDQVLPLYEKIMEILKYTVKDNLELQDVIKVIYDRLKCPLKDKFTLISRLLCINFMRLKGSFQLKDSFNDKMSIFLMDDRFHLTDYIVEIFEDVEPIKSGFTTSGLVHLIHDALRVGSDKFMLKDKANERAINLVYTSIEKNQLLYLDKLFEKFMLYFIREDLIFQEDLCEEETNDLGVYHLDFFSFLTKELHKTRVGSKMGFRDQCFLKKEEYFDD